MKTITLIVFASIASMLVAAPVFSQGRISEVEIRTSAQCEMCKESIERFMTFERGVRYAMLDPESKVLTLRFNNRRADIGNLRDAMAGLGYDADDVPGCPEAYAELPACCKKPDDPDTIPHVPACCSDPDHHH